MNTAQSEPDYLLVDGLEQHQLPVWNRGLAYGDGVFESMRVVNGRIPLWEWHLARLTHGAERLLLSLGQRVLDQIQEETGQQAAMLREGVCKLIVTRGGVAAGYAPRETSCSRILLGYRRDAWSQGAPLHVRCCQLRLSSQPRLAGIKHLNRLEQVMARAEWDDPDMDEGLLFDQSGRLVEATSGNLLFEREGRLFTPALDECGVAGVFRAWLLEKLRAAGLAVKFSSIGPSGLVSLEGMLICNAVQGARLVESLDGQPMPDGPGVRRALQLASSAFGMDETAA